MRRREALSKLFVDKVRFTPVDVDGQRTYRFEAKLSVGKIDAAVAEDDGYVPDEICTYYSRDSAYSWSPNERREDRPPTSR